MLTRANGYVKTQRLDAAAGTVYHRYVLGMWKEEGVQGKSVLITGASRGIGAEAARVFADAGARVCLAARSKGEITQIAEEIGEAAILRG